jgi:hypothetical protein
MTTRVRASLKYLLGTAALAGIMSASFAFLAATVLGVSTVIASVVTGIAAAGFVAYVIHRDGRPDEER